jgi:hypothetical protein
VVQKINKLRVFLVLVAVFFQVGCKFGGIVSVLGTPTPYEKKIPAEYDLTKRAKQKILIFVNQPAYLDAQSNLRYYLTDAMNEKLRKKIKISSKYLVSYEELAEFRSNRADFSLLSPVDVGSALDADMVLLVVIEDYQLEEVDEAIFQNAFLACQTVLFDAATGEKLWPETEESKSIKVGFEVGSGDKELAVVRLSSGCAFCTVRYLYNCPKGRFRIADDRSGTGWEDWQQ